MFYKLRIKKFLCVFLSILTMVLLVACSGEEETVELTPEQQLEMQLTNIVSSPYVEAIRQSRIVSPYAVINSFNKDLNECMAVYNNVMLAVEVKGTDILNGRMFVDDTDINGYYCFFTEGFEDENIEQNRTNFVISIDAQDEYLIPYGMDSTIQREVTDENGNVQIITEQKPKIIEKYFLVGKINKIVGDQITGDEKINIVMSNARLVPATTYQELVVENSENLIEDEILDSNSGESIVQTTFKYKFGKYDYDEDGFCDELIVQVDEYEPESSFDKLIRSDILSKIKTPISTYVQAIYGSDDKLGTFKINYPLKLNTLAMGECTSFDGSYVNYLKLNLLGWSKHELVFDNFVNRLALIENFPELEENLFYLEGKDVFYSVDEFGVKDTVINLLNGETDSASNPKKVWLKDTNVLMSGKINGNNCILTNYPFELIYKPELYFYSDGYIKEGEADKYIFYDVNNYITNGNFLEVSRGEDFQFVSNTNIYVSQEKCILESVELTSGSNALVETGKGYYYLFNNNTGNKEIKTTNVFYTGNQSFKFCSLEKDKDINDLYWLEVLSDKGYKGFIPVKMTGIWTNPNTQYEFYDNISEKSYSLFSESTEYSSIFSKITK